MVRQGDAHRVAPRIEVVVVALAGDPKRQGEDPYLGSA